MQPKDVNKVSFKNPDKLKKKKTVKKVPLKTADVTKTVVEKKPKK
jgi:hypothetical protein